jgi:hypothetical protein
MLIKKACVSHMLIKKPCAASHMFKGYMAVFLKSV